MTAPTGCHTCGGGAGRHDEAAHSDWPAEVDTCDMPTGYGLTCPLPGDHQDGCEMPLPPYSRKPITLPDGAPVIGWSGPAAPTRTSRADVIALFDRAGWPAWGRRFVNKVVPDEKSGCWLWHRVPRGGRHAQFHLPGKLYPVAHRLLWEHVNGPVPEGLQLDHLCRTRHCVNPAHLEPVTSGENTRRSPIALATLLAERTHCDYGHEFTPENTRMRADRPGRRCRICRNKESRLRKQRARLLPKCGCGRPVPASSSCGCCCGECDNPRPARFDERYDPSPEPIDRSMK